MQTASVMEERSFILIAHRGDSSKAPENTIHAFDRALEQGFNNFETDCQLTKDGVVVILHDEQLGKTTTNGTGAVADHTWEQLQHMDAGSWFDAAYAGCRIPSLDDVLQRYKGRAHIHLELKSQQPELPVAVAALVMKHSWDTSPTQPAPSPLPAAAAELDPLSQHPQQQQQQQQSSVHRSFGVPGLTITSFHFQQLQACKQLLPSVTHGWLIQEVTPEIIRQAQQCGFDMVCPRANALTADGVQQLVDQGFVVRAWGVKKLELLQHVVSCGAHGATVNWPAEAAAALGQQQYQQQ